MTDQSKNSEAALRQAIERYNEAWNAHDLDAIVAMHAPDMVFENHTAGESARGDAVREHIATIFDNWPDLAFESRRLYVRQGVVVQEWTARGSGLQWDGVDVIPFEDGLLKRKDVYSASGTAKRQTGLG
jgi:hypothetical protein